MLGKSKAGSRRWDLASWSVNREFKFEHFHCQGIFHIVNGSVNNVNNETSYWKQWIISTLKNVNNETSYWKQWNNFIGNGVCPESHLKFPGHWPWRQIPLSGSGFRAARNKLTSSQLGSAYKKSARRVWYSLGCPKWPELIYSRFSFTYS